MITRIKRKIVDSAQAFLAALLVPFVYVLATLICRKKIGVVISFERHFNDGWDETYQNVSIVPGYIRIKDLSKNNREADIESYVLVQIATIQERGYFYQPKFRNALVIVPRQTAQSGPIITDFCIRSWKDYKSLFQKMDFSDHYVLGRRSSKQYFKKRHQREKHKKAIKRPLGKS